MRKKQDIDILNELTEKILGVCYQVHTNLGPGLLESSYKACLEFDFKSKGFDVEKEKALPLIYKEIKLDVGYRLDLLIERQVILAIKAVETLTDVHTAQVLTYLKLTGCKSRSAYQFQRGKTCARN